MHYITTPKQKFSKEERKALQSLTTKHSSLKILLDSLKASICIIYLVHMPPTTKNKLQFST